MQFPPSGNTHSLAHPSREPVLSTVRSAELEEQKFVKWKQHPAPSRHPQEYPTRRKWNNLEVVAAELRMSSAPSDRLNPDPRGDNISIRGNPAARTLTAFPGDTTRPYHRKGTLPAQSGDTTNCQ